MTKKASSSKAQNSSVSQLVFKGDFQQDINGEIKPGSEVTILFDSERLPFERSADEKGKSAWTISAFYQFAPGGEINKVNLISEKAGTRKKTKTVDEKTVLKGAFTVPHGSEEAIIWFLNTGNTGNEYYDSAFGNNYHFSVSPETAEIENTEPAPVKKRRSARASG